MAGQDGIQVRGSGTPTGLPAPAAARMLSLELGQVLQATIAELLGDGRVRLGLLGLVVDARTTLPLEAGRSYQLAVLATEPELILRPLPSSPAAGVLAAPATAASIAPGLGGRELAVLLDQLAGVLGRARDGHRGVAPGIAQTEWRGGACVHAPALPTAAELMHAARTLGHDQEARVLRLPAQATPSDPEVASLRETWKAAALQLLAGGDSEPPASRAAQSLVQSLHGIELENAQRAEQRQPLWLPLPLPPDGFLRDARLFVGPRDDEDEPPAQGGTAGFRAVLLLDLTRLGQMRVDVEITGSELRARFHVVEPSALPVLREGFAALTGSLQGHGLVVRALDLRLAGHGQLPVADLVPAAARGPSGVVDLHA